MRKTRARHAITRDRSRSTVVAGMCTPARRTRRIASVIMLMVAALLPAAPADATVTFAWAGEWGNSTPIFGIDGYIRASQSVEVPWDSHRLEWINICNSGCTDWVQIGLSQGYLPFQSDPYFVEIYTENNISSACSIYGQGLYGYPANANQAYYVNFDGARNTWVCDGITTYEFAFRDISVTSTPIDLGFLPTRSGEAIANTEVESSNGAYVPLGADYFGTNDAHQAVAGYGLHVQTSYNTPWQGWASSQISTTGTAGVAPPPYYHSISGAYPWAFYTANA